MIRSGPSRLRRRVPQVRRLNLGLGGHYLNVHPNAIRAGNKARAAPPSCRETLGHRQKTPKPYWLPDLGFINYKCEDDLS
jgi:hypothetical protein